MPTTLDQLSVLKAIVAEDLEAVEIQLQKQLSQEPYKAIRDINQYLINTPGKRLRPLLCCLSYHAIAGDDFPTEKNRKQVIELAAAIELIHMASLVHDDVIDHAPIRHNQPSIVAKYGLEVAVPIGVYLYSHSLLNIAKVGNLDALTAISHAVKNLCQGELTQVLDRQHVITIPRYLAILKKKTGVLFAAATQCGAILAGAPKKTSTQFKHFGNAIGLAYQLFDDYMDIMGQAHELKKEPGQDMALGELTLPLLYLIDSLPAEEQPAYLSKLFNGELPLSEIQQTLKNKAFPLEKTKDMACFYLDRAASQVQDLPDTLYRDGLMGIPKYMKSRIL